MPIPKDGRDGKDGDAGKSISVEDVKPLLEELFSAIEIPVPENGKDGRDGIDGKSVTLDEVAPLIEGAVSKIVAPEGPQGVPGEAGKSVTVDDVKPLLEEMVAAIQIPIPENGKDGKDADPVEVAALIIDDVAKLIPPPADGVSVTVEDVLPVIEEIVEKAVAARPIPKDGKDGVGLAGALIGRSGEFVVTLSDGTTKDLGVIIGKDADQDEILRFIEEKISEIPTPKDGRDGFGFEDLEATYDGERTVALKFSRGDHVKEFSFKMPIVLDRGVYKDVREQPYEKGDGVTFGGSFWIAQKDTPEGKPQDGSKDWRLSIKKGRNGADGVVKTLPAPSPVKMS